MPAADKHRLSAGAAASATTAATSHDTALERPSITQRAACGVSASTRSCRFLTVKQAT